MQAMQMERINVVTPQVVSVWARRLVLGPWRFIRRWPVIPAIVLGTLIVAGTFAPWIVPHNPYSGRVRDAFIPPMWAEGGSAKHILGTDHAGRDIMSRIIQGGRISLLVVAVSVSVGFVAGSTLGLMAAYGGGLWDEAIMRLVDIFYAIPYMMIALVVVVIFGQSMTIILVLLGLFSWVGFVRVVRAHTLSVKSMDFISLARIAGASHLRIIVQHIAPMVLSSAVVVATLSVGNLILLEATLSFIGAGIPAPNPAWGTMIAEGRNYISTFWWQAFFPGAAIFLVVMSLNFLGDWLRDRLDPRLRQI